MRKRRLLYVVLLFLVMTLCMGTQAEAKKYKTYKVSTTTKPCDKTNATKAKKDKKAKATYMLKSYLQKIEKAGGGTLVLKKGTYNIYDYLSVPSNTTIQFEKGVKIVAKNKKLSCVFQLVPPSKTGKANYAKKYKGSKNVKFIGAENVTIDVSKTDATAIYLAHNQNVTIQDIAFKKKGNKRYIIELMGVYKVTIDNCTFNGVKKNENAISVDIPAKARTRTRTWSKMDDTINKNVTIKNCKFDKLNRAIVTLRYIKKANTGFVIENNTFTNITGDAVRIINWNNFKVLNNVFKMIGKGGSHTVKNKDVKTGIYMAGVKGLTVQGNYFEELQRPIEIAFYKNTDKALKKVAVVKNNVTAAEINIMTQTSTAKNIRDYFVREYIKHGSTDANIHYFKDDTTNFVITPTDIPYHNEFTNWAGYNENTRQTYVFRAVMAQAERSGKACTVTVKPGTYSIMAEIPLASNVTFYFEDGVVIKKAKNAESNGIFASVAPSNYTTKDIKYIGYNGIHDVKFIGPANGTATIDLNGYDTSIAFVLCHTKNMTIQNLTFKNGNKGHYVELDASNNVLISGCTFSGHVDSTAYNKEAINLDTPDKNTEGFIRGWTSYDCTPNLGVTITNNTFTDMEVAIGSHSYSTGKPHKNIVIKNNTIDGADYAAIQMLNWENVTVEGNTISNFQRLNKDDYALIIRGVKNATIRNNVIKDGVAVARITEGKMSGKNAAANAYPAVPWSLTGEQMGYLKTGNTMINLSDPHLMVNETGTYTRYECN